MAVSVCQLVSSTSICACLHAAGTEHVCVFMAVELLTDGDMQEMVRCQVYFISLWSFIDADLLLRPYYSWDETPAIDGLLFLVKQRPIKVVSWSRQSLLRGIKLATGGDLCPLLSFKQDHTLCFVARPWLNQFPAECVWGVWGHTCLMLHLISINVSQQPQKTLSLSLSSTTVESVHI